VDGSGRFRLLPFSTWSIVVLTILVSMMRKDGEGGMGKLDC